MKSQLVFLLSNFLKLFPFLSCPPKKRGDQILCKIILTELRNEELVSKHKEAVKTLASMRLVASNADVS